MKPTSVANPSTSKGEFLEPAPISKPTRSSSYELHPSLKAMFRALPFLGHVNENPCNHLLDFKEMCSCLSISGMTQETLRWKLFPFSLTGKAKQWYVFAVESMNGDWDQLKDKFYLTFFPMSSINSLPRAILDFEQCEKEPIGAPWAWFSMLMHAGPNLSLADGVILRLFCSGLNIDADLYLDVTAGGRFTHKTMTEQVEFLEHFIAIHTSSVIRTKPLYQKSCRVWASPH
jgi:hypothetical protein